MLSETAGMPVAEVVAIAPSRAGAAAAMGRGEMSDLSGDTAGAAAVSAGAAQLSGAAGTGAARGAGIGCGATGAVAAVGTRGERTIRTLPSLTICVAPRGTLLEPIEPVISDRSTAGAVAMASTSLGTLTSSALTRLTTVPALCSTVCTRLESWPLIARSRACSASTLLISVRISLTLAPLRREACRAASTLSGMSAETLPHNRAAAPATMAIIPHKVTSDWRNWSAARAKVYLPEKPSNHGALR